MYFANVKPFSCFSAEGACSTFPDPYIGLAGGERLPKNPTPSLGFRPTFSDLGPCAVLNIS